MPGNGSYFFPKKVTKKLSPAPFAFNGSALAISSLPPACGRLAGKCQGRIKAY